MRLIDADELRKRMYHEAFETDTNMQRWDSGCWIRYKMFENTIEVVPTVDPVKHGQWEWDKDGMDWGIGSWRCSICGSRPSTFWNTVKRNPKAFGGSLFCGECGAKMDGENDETD